MCKVVRLNQWSRRLVLQQMFEREKPSFESTQNMYILMFECDLMGTTWFIYLVCIREEDMRVIKTVKRDMLRKYSLIDIIVFKFSVCMFWGNLEVDENDYAIGSSGKLNHREYGYAFERSFPQIFDIRALIYFPMIHWYSNIIWIPSKGMPIFLL